MQLAADVIGLISILLFAVPALYASRIARTVLTAKKPQVVFGDPEAEKWRNDIVKTFFELKDQWTPWKGWCLIGGIATGAISYVILLLKDYGVGH
jgi:hypothetical protein